MNDCQFICITKLEKRKTLPVDYPDAMIISGFFFPDKFCHFSSQKIGIFFFHSVNLTKFANVLENLGKL
jgi:hypothetical protein